MKLCAACHQDLPKDKFSKKQWKLGAECQRRCTSCVRDNREVQQPPLATNNESDNNNTGIVTLLDSISINDNEVTVSDEELFKQPQPAEDCPICFLLLPLTGWIYMPCCGKVICGGCCHAPVYDDQGNEVDNEKCPFCRIPTPASEEEAVEREKKRVEAGDAQAMYNQGLHLSQN